MRVLIAEDERMLADAVAEGLREEAFAVDVVHDGDSALERLSVNDYDVLLLDRDLPVVHGDEVCRAVVESGSRARVLMVTAASDVPSRIEGLAIGADDYLTKPFAFEELVARVHALARRTQPAGPPTYEQASLRVETGAARSTRRPLRIPRTQGVRRPVRTAAGGWRGRLGRGTPGAGLGRARRSVHQRRPRDRDETAQETRAAAGHPDRPGLGVPDPMRLTSRLPRLAIRVRLHAPVRRPVHGLRRDPARRDLSAARRGTDQPVDGVALQITKEGGIAPVPEASAHNLPSEPAAGLAGSPELRELQDRYRAATLQSLLRQGALALGVLTVVATLFGYLMAGRVLRPLNRISQTARRITSRGDLSERLAFTGPRDEVTELADTFDSMMGRLEKSFQDQQRFIADASHELRTPLAINRTLVEVALRRKTATEDTKRLGTSLLAVNERNERLINGLLALAKGETEVANRTPVDLTELARHTAELHQSQAAEAGIGLRLDTRPATTSGNAVMLERIIHNLLENAIRYNEPNGWVRLTTRTTPHGAATLTVENTGPVVAARTSRRCSSLSAAWERTAPTPSGARASAWRSYEPSRAPTTAM